jgi:GT2 family glycosyltransferase
VSSQRVRVSVIIPTHNSPAQVACCLAAIGASSGSDVEIIAADDASTDETLEVARAAGARLVRLARNSGPAAARNAGARIAYGEVLLFVDQDVIVAPGTIERVARTLHERPELAAIFGSYDAAPLDPGVVSQFRNLLHHYIHQHGDPEASTFWAGCGAVRREVFQSVGGFDVNLVLEDIELGYRLRQHGFRILLDPELQVKHAKVWTLRSMIRTDILRRAVPWAKLILRTRTAPGSLNLRPAQRWSVALTGIALALAVASPVAPSLLLPAGAALIGILTLNASFYRFLCEIRGIPFALAGVFLHLLYFTCCALGAAWTLLGGGGDLERKGV